MLVNVQSPWSYENYEWLCNLRTAEIPATAGLSRTACCSFGEDLPAYTNMFVRLVHHCQHSISVDTCVSLTYLHYRIMWMCSIVFL